MKKITKMVCSLAIVGAISTTTAYAATSTVHVGGSNISPTGKTISATNIGHTGENFGKVTFVSYAKKVRDYQLDLTINSATLYAGDDFSRNASPGNGKYYVKAKVTGDGAYNASGETSVWAR